ncbi:TPA: DUF4391 domain-containing protein [Klebsiella pneumoniae subsp. pneumoniae]|uniref:DUF4391 domain-containing protein n=1 Tax=Klebsiella pneumoniae TaxID=573 RepID=UPI0022436B12|nr:DUF4391 domain-containing protein [Klebsiella pneumoniae]HBW3297588.1 DUF4391 domain-containing protein [Klebsiella pneumoniae]HBZ7909363.1 DUF4391 domain-containing protein [Klebsiella pneumoniae]HDS9415181.1 DUF4391 domain-containing protein [Klebsiella pneumoniae]HDU4452021.1 DUF4391 domain-containing protein [Klebsiella pneumoniae subsp. pneumoniae]
MSDMGLGLPKFEVFLEGLNVPSSCVLNKPLFKKMFQQHADLDAKDKKALKDDVDKIRWLYTLKPSIINIGPFSDDLRDYGELACLHVVLSNTRSAERVGYLINRAIPYPLVIFFVHSENKGTEETGEPDLNVREKQHAKEQLAICLADKRINKADQAKWVIEDFQLSPWLSLSNVTEIAKVFFNSLNFTSLPHSNFWQFYQAFMCRVQALQCAEVSGRFCLVDGEAAEQQRQQLQHYRQIEQDIKNLRAQIKQAEFSQQVALNTQIKQQEQRLRQIANTL